MASAPEQPRDLMLTTAIERLRLGVHSHPASPSAAAAAAFHSDSTKPSAVSALATPLRLPRGLDHLWDALRLSRRAGRMM